MKYKKILVLAVALSGCSDLEDTDSGASDTRPLVGDTDTRDSEPFDTDTDALETDEQDIDSAETDEQGIDSAETDEQDIDSAETDEQDIDSAETDEQDIDSAETDVLDTDGETGRVRDTADRDTGTDTATGSDSGLDTPTVVPLTVDAGPVQTVDEGALVVLAGSVLPELGDATVQWSQTLGTPVAWTAADSLSPSFTAPPVAADTLLSFTLQIMDGDVVVAEDDTSVLVRTTNQPPVVDAGVDQAIDELLPVVLSGSATDSDGTIVHVEWLQLAGPEVALTDSQDLTTRFDAPAVGGTVTLLFRLIVTDEDGSVGSDEVAVTVSPVNVAPVVDAGMAQSVAEEDTVTLLGSASDEDGFIAGTLWVQTGGPLVTLDDPSSLVTTFVAPQTGVETSVSFRLEALDDDGALAYDSVTISVQTTNTAPAVDAGADQAVSEADVVTLSGSALDDGVVASHRWVQVSGPGVVLDDPDAWLTTFTVPALREVTVFGFRLDVMDDDQATGTDHVYVTATPRNAPPSVDAGADQVVDEGTTVTLLGSASDSDGAIAEVSWTQASGVLVVLDDPSLLAPTFVAPEVIVPTVLSFVLTATDDEGSASYDTMTVLVEPLNALPVASAGEDRVVTAGEESFLLGAATDSDGVIARTTWREVGTDLVVLSDTSALSPSFTPPDLGFSYTIRFELEVEDDEGAVHTDTVLIVVEPANPINQAPTVSAGPDRVVVSGATIAMTGVAEDVDGVVVRTAWSQVSGPAVTLTDEDTLTPTWETPDAACAAVVVFELLVEDDDGATATDQVSFVVEGDAGLDPLVMPVILDLEDDPGGLLVDGSLWSWGIPTTGPDGAYDGSRVWATNLAGAYTASAEDYACLPPIDLSDTDGAVLSFRAFIRIGRGDAFIVEGLDPQAGWVPLVDAEPAPTSIASGTPSWDNTSVLQDWSLHAVSLPSWLGDTGRLRLVLRSDSVWQDLGVYLDELRVDHELSDPDGDGLDGVFGEWMTYGTDPFEADSDEDGFDDGVEVASETGPLNVSDYPGQMAVQAGFLWDFESDDGGLISNDGVWQHGAPSSGPQRAHSGSQVWATNLAGAYPANARSMLYLPPLDLSATTEPTLAARLWMSGGTVDGLSVESFNEATQAWQPLMPAQPAYEALDATGLSAWRTLGYLDEYVTVAVPLDALVGDVVRLRLALRTDSVWQGDGAYIDDLAVYDEGEDPDGDGIPGVLGELLLGTDPFVADTDGDGSDDGEEQTAGTDPLDPAWSPSTQYLLPGDYLDFESDDGGLVAMSADWSHGVVASGPGTGWSGSQAWATNPAGNYASGRRAFVHVPPIDLRTATATSLSFRLWMAGAAGDGVSVEAWRDSGEWATLHPSVTVYESTDALGQPAWRHQEAAGEYVLVVFDLDAFVGDLLRVRLALRTDGAWNQAGAYIDDLAISRESDDPDGDGLIGVLGEISSTGTDPFLQDSDGDGYDDGVEISQGLDPLNPAHHPGAPWIVPGVLLDFEDDDGGFVTDGVSWEVGSVASGPGAAWSGSRVWATNLDGPYGRSQQSTVLLPPIDLTTSVAPTLSMRLWMDGLASDGVGLDVQTLDGGWSRVSADEPVPYDAQDAQGLAAFQLVDELGDYGLVTFDLSTWSGRIVAARLHLSSNGSGQGDGAYVDDVRLDQEGSDPDGDGIFGVATERQLYGTDPYDPDTDGDGASDGSEVSAGTDPLDPLSVP